MAVVQQFCAYNFWNGNLENLDTISLIDVYERLIHAAIQYKESPPYLYNETHIPG
jgi:hypothetical protein